MSKFSFPLNRNQVLLLFAIGAVCYNSYLHFISPAYRYYTESIKSLRSDFDKFKSTIESDFLPAVYFIATNSHVVVSSPVAPARDSNGSLGILDASFFICQGRRGFVFNGYVFFAGDDFFGYPILGISPTIVTTSQGFFYLNKSPYFENQKEEKQ